MSAEALEQMTVPWICDALSRFISSNTSSAQNEHRWLAEYLTDTLQVAQHVRNGNLTEDERKLVTSFRLGELQKEKIAKQREIDQIDTAAKRLMNA